MDQLLYQQTSTYLYDANDDRGPRWTCALDGCGDDRDATVRRTQRGLDGEVLRVAEGPTRDTLEWSADFVYGSGRALARVAPDGTDYLLHDHLGSMSLITLMAPPIAAVMAPPATDRNVLIEMSEGRGSLSYVGRRV